MSVVLETQPSGNYEPSENEIWEYGKWLGMQLPEDSRFLWIAREGLKAPLPEHWKACKSEKGELYYFNFKTGKSIWDHPMDDHFKELLKTEKKSPSARSLQPEKKKNSEENSISKKLKKNVLSETVEGKQGESNSLKTPKLNSLKINKTLPESLKIDFDATSSGTSKSRLKSLPNSGNLEKKEVKRLSPSLTEKKSTPESILCSGKFAPREEIISSGISGLKALSRLSSPAATNSSADKEIGESTKGKTVSSILVGVNENEGEKENLTLNFKKELEEYKEKLENEKKKKIELYNEEQSMTLLAEKNKLDAELAVKIESLKKEYSDLEKAESNRIREDYQKKITQEKEQLENSLKKEVEDARAKIFSQIHEANENAVRNDLQRSSLDLKQFGESFIRAYEENFSAFSRAVARSMSDADLKLKQIDQEKKELDFELRRLKDDNRLLLLEEKEKLISELEELKRNHLQKIHEVNVLNEKEIEALKNDHRKELEATNEEVKRLQSLCDEHISQQKELEQKISKQTKELAVNSASVITSSQEDLQRIKRELIDNAKAELNAVLQEINNEKKAFLLSQKSNSIDHQLVSSPTSVEMNKSEEVGEKCIESGEEEKIENASSRKPPAVPLLDNELLKPLSEINQFPESPSQREDLRLLLTEIFREIFEKSPFIFSSAQTSPSGNHLNHLKGDLSLPKTEQSEIVENERRRLIQAAGFIKHQRHNIEEKRRKLRFFRNQWKKAVLEAKKDGILSKSSRGKELKRQGAVLESKSGKLARELAILHESELWLEKKKLRLSQYESLLEECSNLHPVHDGEQEALNYSVDTTYLMTDYFNPHHGLSPKLTRQSSEPKNISSRRQAQRTSSPTMASALHRIEQRLDKVSAMIEKKNHQAAKSRMMSPPEMLNPATPSPEPHSMRRLRHNRGQFRSFFSQNESADSTISATAIHHDPYA